MMFVKCCVSTDFDCSRQWFPETIGLLCCTVAYENTAKALLIKFSTFCFRNMHESNRPKHAQTREVRSFVVISFEKGDRKRGLADDTIKRVDCKVGRLSP